MALASSFWVRNFFQNQSASFVDSSS